MIERKRYSTRLQAGLGLVDETQALLELWQPGMSSGDLHQAALDSGRFPTVTARRLRNIVVECFAPRYLVDSGAPAAHLKRLGASLAAADLAQLMLLFTCRANAILGDFVRDEYWPRYAAGYTEISNDNARAFVERGIDDGRTVERWSETTVRRVSAYLTGCCADYGLLDKGTRSLRRILPVRVALPTAAYLAHELHFAGAGDNALLTHEDWQLFGLGRQDVLEELKRLSRAGFLMVQAAGDVVHLSWKYNNMEAVLNVLSES